MNRQKHNGPGDGQDKPLTDEQLLSYLEGRMSPEEQHELEEWFSEEGPEADAIEGLQQIHTEEAKRTVNELNHLLHKQLLRATPKRRKAFSEDHWAWVAIIVILLLIIVGFVVIKIADQ